MIRAAVFGSTGYTGANVLRLLHAHPQVELAYAVSRSSAGSSLADHFPRAPQVELVAPEQADLTDVEVVFLCLPHGQSAPWAVRALEAGAKVVDLSADFRLRSLDTYERWYETTHPAPDLLDEGVYGLTEIARPELAAARLVANPGCYPTSALLALYPLANQLGSTVIVDAKSGVSGAGRRPKLATHFVEVADDFTPYNIGRSHRHVPEIEQQLADWGAASTELVFAPHLLPVPRGLLSTVYLTFEDPPDLEAVYAAFESRYGDEPFVRLLPAGTPATLGHVVRTNLAAVGVAAAGRSVIVTCAIDNLLKGASGQAVQNMNAMFGLPEATGLLGREESRVPCG